MNHLDDELRKGEGISVIRLVELLVEQARATRSSDIHLDPRESGMIVRLRTDGILRDAHVLPKMIEAQLISRLKILSGLRTDEHQASQDGRFRITDGDDRPIDVRVSIMPTYRGENAVMRILFDQSEEFTLESLGFTKANQEKILRAIRKPHGMVLATGPTGSGKTTTLYTLIKILNRPESSIITIEDPVEYAIHGINQIQIQARTGLSFANGLRSILRQDPNVIMVGEIRDVETAGLAVNTALTGHLVLSTLHTNDAPTTLPRLLDMKVEPFLIASTVSVAIGQRLVRLICDGCRSRRSATDAERESISGLLAGIDMNGAGSLWYGTGCEACAGTGYRGRIGLHEVMEIDKDVREAILQKRSASHLRDIAMRNGMRSILMDGLSKAIAGLTTFEEVIRIRHE